MPTIFSHAVFAAVAGKSLFAKLIPWWFWFLTAVCAIIPDADVATRWLGAERGGMFSHRGFTHSIAFALLFGALAAFVAARILKTEIPFFKLFVFFSLSTFSHPLLDMLTNGGSGVALFTPFSNERYFFPWRPVEVSPIGLRFFGERGLKVIFSEIIWIWLPAGLILLTATIVRRMRKNG